MRWSDLPLRPSPRTLRQFAGLWIIFFTGLACWQYSRHGKLGLALALLAVAVIVGPMGLLRPRWIQPIFVGWMCMAFPLGWVISHAFLGILFYGVFTPVGLLFRLIGRDVLDRRGNPAQDSYWKVKPMPRDAGSYLRQS